MTRKLTRITPIVEGYAVVVAQKQGVNGKPGPYLGCFLQTPESPDDGPCLLLSEAMAVYLKLTDIPKSNDNAASADTFDNAASNSPMA